MLILTGCCGESKHTHVHTHTHTEAADSQSSVCVMNNTGWEFDQWPVAESLCAGLRLRKVLFHISPCQIVETEARCCAHAVYFLFTPSQMPT